MMQYMDIVIVKGALNDRYEKNATWIVFSIQGTVINVEERYWNICETCLLRG